MNDPPLERWFGIRAPLPIMAEGDIGMNGGEMVELADLPPEEKQPQWFRELGWTEGSIVPTKPNWWDDTIEDDHERMVAHALETLA